MARIGLFLLLLCVFNSCAHGQEVLTEDYANTGDSDGSILDLLAAEQFFRADNTCTAEKTKDCLDKQNALCRKNDEGGTEECFCDTSSAMNNGVCKETCNDDCKNGMPCEGEEGSKLCNCVSGLSGDKCETIDACAEDLKECDGGTRGECTFKTDKAVCECTEENTALDSSGKFCKDCECGKMSTGCTFSADGKKCGCQDNYADKNGQCTDCACGEKSTGCTFSEDEKKSCICQENYADKNGQCTEICASDTDCYYGMSCDGETKFCNCEEGLSGDKCETVDACSADFKKCTGDAGNCTFVENKPVCNCKPKTALDASKAFCKDCACGEKSTGCTFSEDGKKSCICQENYADKNGQCTDCACGEKSTGCTFSEDGKKLCICQENYADKNGQCTETCAEDADCNNGMPCEMKKKDDKDGFCKCTEGLSGDLCEVIDDCSSGKLKNCKDKKGTCEFNGTDAVCNCDNDKLFDSSDGVNYCKAPCSDNDDCSNGMKCNIDEEKEEAFCQCVTGLSGDYCEIIDECQKTKYANCKGDLGECTFEAGKSVCKCGDGKALDSSDGVNHCKTKCSKAEDCKHGAKCVSEVCKCKKGTKGDFCEEVTDCNEKMINDCEANNATCKYDVAGTKATCVCNEKGYEYSNRKCTPTWCKNERCKDNSECLLKDGTGYCKCKVNEENKDEKLYYNYTTNKCEALDKCLTKNIKCDKNKMCVDGACVCPVGYNENNETKECEPRLCETNPCFTTATCKETTTLGMVTCTCQKEFSYFDGKACKVNGCVLGGGTDCRCPPQMEKKEKKCVHKTDETKCEKDDCGYGYCIKKKIKDKLTDTCVCYDGNLVELREGKCVLKKEICASKMLDGEKCNCTGAFKMSKQNGITCEARTCADEDVQKECKSKGADCVDNWKWSKENPNIGYKCKCPTGFLPNDEDICVDACITEDQRKCGDKQMCVSTKETGSRCECIPGFSLQNGACLPQKNIGLLLKDVVVESGKYLRHGPSISIPQLNEDVNSAMKMVYHPNLKFAYILSYRYDKDSYEIICNIWLQFKEPYSEEDKKRWEFQAVDNVLPPSLKLKRMDKVEEEDIDVCSPAVSMKLCGKGSSCKDGKCSCLPGYKIMDGTYQKVGETVTLRCEDVDECATGTNKCPSKTICENTEGSYYCKCQPGEHKVDRKDDEALRECTGLCTPNPCNSGKCDVNKKEFNIECSCDAGFAGAFCDKKDINYAAAKKSTAVVGAVLGTILGVMVLLAVLYIVRQKKNSDSEDFSSARMDSAEMAERRPVRGVTNRAYQ